MHTNPKFVVFEGADGVGKSTLVEEVALRMDAVVLSTPGRDFAAVREHMDVALAGCSEAMQVWYAATVLAASCRVSEALAAGRSVVMDRYWLSTVCYAQLRGGALPLKDVEAALRPADVTVYLRAPLAVRRERVGRRSVLQPHDRMTLSEVGHARLEAAFRSYETAGVVGRWLELDTSRHPPAELAKQLLASLERHVAA